MATEPGIPLALARRRARTIGDVRCALDLAIDAQATRATGSIAIDFVWRPAQRGRSRAVDAVLLDYRPLPGGRCGEVTLNGTALRPGTARPGHLALPAHALVAGTNRLTARLTAPILPAGGPLNLYVDPADGARYVYSLLVPADASLFFPCFDQPDLKARFTLALALPHDWTAVANAPVARDTARAGVRHIRFRPTEPISTYLFAFAAGPWVPLAAKDRAVRTRLWVRRSRRREAVREADTVLGLDHAVVRDLTRYLAHPFPFAKYDLVLVPDFPYRGMEHAGATFLREDCILLGPNPSPAQAVQRAQLVFHETAHQWMGNLVTMRWFDDLWLKEGFANFFADRAARALTPTLPGAIATHALTASGVHTDATRGTMPLRQPLADLAHAKASYGAIVYAKGPAVLRQAEHWLGPTAFRGAVRDFVRRHAYDTATSADLVRAFARAGGRSMAAWSRAWIERPGAPLVRVDLSPSPNGRIARATITQTGAGPARGPWPLALTLAFRRRDGRVRSVPVRVTRRTTQIGGLIGQPMPSFLFPDRDAQGYGAFLLDRGSLAFVLEHLSTLNDPLLRAQVWESLWESVRRAVLDPAAWVTAAIRHLPAETDPTTLARVLADVRTCLFVFLGERRRTALADAVETTLRRGMLAAPSTALRRAWLAGHLAIGATPRARRDIEALLDGTLRIRGVTLGPADRLACVGALAALGSRATAQRARRLTAHRTGDDARFEALRVRAARADPRSKRAVLDVLLSDASIPDRRIDAMLDTLNDPRHAVLTLPLLARALAAVPRLARTRKIFFVGRWLASWLGGQHDARAVAIVQRVLASGRLDPPLARKLREAADTLERAIRIRRTFPDT